MELNLPPPKPRLLFFSEWYAGGGVTGRGPVGVKGATSAAATCVKLFKLARKKKERV